MERIFKGFFAYPSRPAALAETVRIAADRIKNPTFELTVWEHLRIGGKIIIDEIFRRIDESDVFLAEVTGVNPNVMFELGYAVGAKKRIWLALDTSRAGAKRDYDQFRLLAGVGYCPYVGSQDIVNGFFKDLPFEDLNRTVFASDIEPILTSSNSSGVLYLKGRYDTDADRKISEAVARNAKEGLTCIIDDPNETRVQPLAWYAQSVYSAHSVLAHLCSEDREDARIHNAREAFVCGLAVGFGKRLLILAEQDYSAPLDYKDLLVHYATAREAVSQAEVFLSQSLRAYRDLPSTHEQRFGAIQLGTELKGLRLGDYLAENEADRLNEYFVDTSAYRAVLDGRHAIFVGRKGTGKTANLIHAASELRLDKRNLVVVIQPVGYDLSGLNGLLRSYRERDTKGYLVDSLWKFLIYSEIGQTAVASLEQRPSGTFSGAEQELLEVFRSAASPLAGDFAVRLERVLSSLQSLELVPGIEARRVAISEALHTGVLSNLRRILGQVLTERERVAVLIDNLDRAWRRDDDLDQVGELIFGLLGTAERMSMDFARADARRKPVNVTLAIFLRTDIFQYITRTAGEPDKLSFSRITWEDREFLMRVLDERLVASQVEPTSADSLWRRYFTANMAGVPVREYLASRTLPRPRDIVYLAKAAVATAINRGHAQVLESDIFEAERQYSQYALDTIETEATAAFPRLGDLLYEFAGAKEILERTEIEEFMRKAKFDQSRFQEVLEFLLAFGFLALEVRDGEFEFAADENELRRNFVLARNLQDSTSRENRYMVHKSFHSYLDIRKHVTNTISPAGH